LFVDAIEPKQFIAPALNTLIGDHKKVFVASYAKIHEAIHALVKRAIKSGDIRKDLDPMDLLRALVGFANVASHLFYYHEDRTLVGLAKVTPAGRPTEIRSAREGQIQSLARLGGLQPA
jgi:hypothetical protein